MLRQGDSSARAPADLFVVESGVLQAEAYAAGAHAVGAHAARAHADAEIVEAATVEVAANEGVGLDPRAEAAEDPVARCCGLRGCAVALCGARRRAWHARRIGRLAVYTRGAAFGQAALLYDARAKCTVVCTKDARVWELRRRDLVAVLCPPLGEASDEAAASEAAGNEAVANEAVADERAVDEAAADEAAADEAAASKALGAALGVANVRDLHQPSRIWSLGPWDPPVSVSEVDRDLVRASARPALRHHV